MMNCFDLRPRKWPFESKDVDDIIKTLEQHRDTMCGGLDIEQTYVGLILYLQHAGPRHEPEDDPKLWWACQAIIPFAGNMDFFLLRGVHA
jgi:hypothetical protein